MPLLWCSFVKDNKFQGVVITEADNVEEASKKLWKLGVNPGGEIMAFVLPRDRNEATQLPHDTLLTKAQISAFGAKRIGDESEEVLREIDKASLTVEDVDNTKKRW